MRRLSHSLGIDSDDLKQPGKKVFQIHTSVDGLSLHVVLAYPVRLNLMEDIPTSAVELAIDTGIGASGPPDSSNLIFSRKNGAGMFSSCFHVMFNGSEILEVPDEKDIESALVTVADHEMIDNLRILG
jgi:hypothetical protein